MKRLSLLSSLLTASSLVLLAGCVCLAYTIHRDDTSRLLALYSLTFIAYLGCYRLAHTSQHIRQLLVLAVVVRMALLPAMPNLSDDVYRFVWDGRLLYQGYDPFAYLPSEILAGQGRVEAVGIDSALFRHLNSPDYYTIYPPVNQAVFAWAAWISPTSVRGSAVVIRLIILAAELLTLWLLVRLLPTAEPRHRWPPPLSSPRYAGLSKLLARIGYSGEGVSYRVPRKNVLLYALNPLVILELTGNLHFEALMIAFVLGSVYLWRRQQLILSAGAMALGICTKLLPLILLPLYWWRLRWKKAMLFYGVVGLTSVALFFPLVTPELIAGMRNSVGLYFQKFEFNASLYYLIREVGYYQKGYNIIAQAGRWLAIITFVSIVLYSIVERRKNLLAAYGSVWLIFLLFSTTVHPWYVTPLLAYTVFTPYRYAVLWSGLIFFSYAGYTATGFSENLGITLVEYAVVGLTLGYELLDGSHLRKSL